MAIGNWDKISTTASSSFKENDLNLSDYELSKKDLADIVKNKDTSPKELTKKYFNKSVSLKGGITGSYVGKSYMVIWVSSNNTYVGCLSTPSNEKFKKLNHGDVVAVSGVVHHIENEKSLGNKIILAHGCAVDEKSA